MKCVLINKTWILAKKVRFYECRFQCPKGNIFDHLVSSCKINAYAFLALGIVAHVIIMTPFCPYQSPFFRLIRPPHNYDRLDVMRKVWTYKRKGMKGWWASWYESGKRKAKALPTKALAEHYRQIKYTQLNSDVFTGTITVDWQQMRDEYEHSKKVAGITENSLYEVALTLRNLERLVGKCNSKQITQNAIDRFILERG